MWKQATSTGPMVGSTSKERMDEEDHEGRPDCLCGGLDVRAQRSQCRREGRQGGVQGGEVRRGQRVQGQGRLQRRQQLLRRRERLQGQGLGQGWLRKGVQGQGRYGGDGQEVRFLH